MLPIVLMPNLLYTNYLMPRAKYQSLQTIRTIGTLKATGSLFLNGVSNKYDSTPPKLLTEILPPKEILKF